MDRYDLAVMGSGPAGHSAALKAARSGLSVILIEKEERMFGGVCLNEGCIPAKSLYHGAYLIHSIRSEKHLLKRGKEIDLSADIQALLEKSREASKTLAKGLLSSCRSNKIDMAYGKAVLKGTDTIVITDADGNSRSISFGSLVIATGSIPKVLPGIPFDGRLIISSSQAITMSELPETMLIIGGGAIGVELSCYFTALGVKIDLVEAEDRLLSQFDNEISRKIRTILEKHGVKVITGAKVTCVKMTGGKIEASISAEEALLVSKYDKTLVSTGRTPNTRGIGLEEACIALDGKGFIKVDRNMRTNIRNIYAAGDVIATPMLAHTASIEGERAAMSVKGIETESLDYSTVPNVVYSMIKAAGVGSTEEELRANNAAFVTGKYHLKGNGRAVTQNDTEGFVKILADKQTRKVLGAWIVGSSADELIHELVIAKKNGITVDGIADTIHAHPTLSEALQDAAKACFKDR
ncbi:MAG: dihydrolipoyl dehydrogenase [Candidatus Omnitrophica bacterium]|nr:dihydrolipoyl dehydrogenase [Candidatus Omnitrophota bacterium]